MSLASRKGFMVRAMEIVEEWCVDNGIMTTNAWQYELAERMWNLWQQAGKEWAAERGPGCPFSGLCMFAQPAPEHEGAKST